MSNEETEENQLGPDYYSILGIKATASQEQIRKAFKRLSQKHHPDKSPDDFDLYRMIRKAYEILSDPARKAVYDSGVRQGINPEEFQQALAATIEKIVIRTLAKLDAVEGLFTTDTSFKKEALRQIEYLRGKIEEDRKEAVRRGKVVSKYIESITDGKESRIYESLVKKQTEVNSVLIAFKVQLAVLDFLREDADQLVCKTAESERRAGAIAFEPFPYFDGTRP